MTAQTLAPRRVTLADAVKSAVQFNHDLAAAKHEVGRADARLREAWGYALPSIDFTGQYSRAIKKPVFFFPNIFDTSASAQGQVVPIEIGSNHSINLNVTVSQVLFSSAVFTGVGTAKIYSQAAREVYRSKECETIASTRKAFYGVLLTNEVRAMLRSNLANAEDNLKNVSILAEQGLLSEYDKLRAEVGVANLRPEVIRAENNYDLALNNLKIVMGLQVADEIELDGSLEYAQLDQNIISHSQETVLDHNPGLAALRYQREVNDAFSAIERSNYLPSLAAFGNYQLQTQKNDLRISTNDFVKSALVGLSLSINLFNGFRTAARVEQAELDTRKTEEQIANTEKVLRTAVQSTVMTLGRAGERVLAQQRTVEQAEKGYRIATTRFTSGSGTQLEVNDAQLALTTAKTNRMQAVYDYLIASAELDQLLGRTPDYVQGLGLED
ncbi:MAG: TolC family protein [Ignavibacteriae bacterium]|nr:TolC family protein [Ignavibacteriota bacterium]